MSGNPTKPTLDHPMFARVRAEFPAMSLKGSEFRGQSTLVVAPGDVHTVLAFLKGSCGYDLLSDVSAVDYRGYSAQMPGRFGVFYNAVNTGTDERFFVKTYLDPSIPTEGIEKDPALVLDSVTDLWPGAEWMEREVYDMFGIRFRNHPDLRRILTWEAFPGHPLRKDYPLRGRGERESYRIVDRTSS
jgi:NADH-quinone oxidoreductase subunit C